MTECGNPISYGFKPENFRAQAFSTEFLGSRHRPQSSSQSQPGLLQETRDTRKHSISRLIGQCRLIHEAKSHRHIKRSSQDPIFLVRSQSSPSPHCVPISSTAYLTSNHAYFVAILAKSIADGARTSWSSPGVSAGSPSTHPPPTQWKFQWSQPPLLGIRSIPKHERVSSRISSQHSIPPRPASLYPIPPAGFVPPSACWAAGWGASYPRRTDPIQRLVGRLDRFSLWLEPKYAPSYALQRSSTTYGFQCLPAAPSRGWPSRICPEWLGRRPPSCRVFYTVECTRRTSSWMGRRWRMEWVGTTNGYPSDDSVDWWWRRRWWRWWSPPLGSTSRPGCSSANWRRPRSCHERQIERRS